jgi:hypothetical protein
MMKGADFQQVTRLVDDKHGDVGGGKVAREERRNRLNVRPAVSGRKRCRAIRSARPSSKIGCGRH